MPTNNSSYLTSMFPNGNYPSNPHQIIWVKGLEEAKRYQLPKNSNAVLFDSEEDGKFYIKITDDIGMYNIRYFTFQEYFPSVSKTSTTGQNDSYVTYDQLTNILSTMQSNILGKITESVKEANNEHAISAVNGSEPASPATNKYNIVSTTNP